MIQTRPYEYLARYTPQREWIEKRGILMLLAMFFIELGAGAFLVSSIFNNLPGMFAGWLLCGALGGGFHLVFLGHPFRAWRMAFSNGWKSSWISRGLIFVTLFLALGLISMILAQAATPNTGLLVAADVFAFLAVIYVGFVMAEVNAIPLWSTPLLPVLYLILGVWGGLGITMITLQAAGAAAPIATVEEWSRVFLIAFVFIVLVYLTVMRYQGTGGKIAVKEIIAGKLAPLFWIIVAILGTALPVGAAVVAWGAGVEIPTAFVITLIILELLGDLALRYCILKAGLYAPLIPTRQS